MMIGLVHNFFFMQRMLIDGFNSSTHNPFYYDANAHSLPPAFVSDDKPDWLWLIVFPPVVGGLVVAFLVQNWAPEAKGHGVPEVMDAIHYKRGRIRPSVAGVKILASSFSIGSGGAP